MKRHAQTTRDLAPWLLDGRPHPQTQASILRVVLLAFTIYVAVLLWTELV